MSKREGFFECVFASEGNEYQFHLRAWNEQEAEQHFRETLGGYGVRSSGTLSIRDLKGRVLRRAGYEPTADGGEAPAGLRRRAAQGR